MLHARFMRCACPATRIDVAFVLATLLACTCAHAQLSDHAAAQLSPSVLAEAATDSRDATPTSPRGATLQTPRGATLQDERLEPHVPVFGIVIGDEPRAYALSDLVSAAADRIHDLVGTSRIDVGLDGNEAHVLRTEAPIRERRMTTWKDWIRLHPDSSLWRPPAIAEPEADRDARDIRVTESRHYKTGFGCAMVPARLTSVGEVEQPPGLFVISGTIENVGRQTVHHVVLRYELVDETGIVLYRDEGFNRSAEALAAPKLTNAGAVVPIDSGKTDTFRMIFLSDELPAFARTRVTVSRVY